MKKIIKSILSVFGIRVYSHMPYQDVCKLERDARIRTHNKALKRWNESVEMYGYKSVRDYPDSMAISKAF